MEAVERVKLSVTLLVIGGMSCVVGALVWLREDADADRARVAAKYTAALAGSSFVRDVPSTHDLSLLLITGGLALMVVTICLANSARSSVRKPTVDVSEGWG